MIIEIDLKPTLSPEEYQWMEQRFDSLCHQLELPVQEISIWRQELFTNYENADRYYHNLVHVYNFIKLFEEHKTAIEKPLLFEVAIWWHDAIYEAKRNDNETRSVQLALRCWKNYLSTTDLKYIAILISSTEKHLPLIEENDVHYFLDMDLSILATANHVYQQYVSYIEKEYTTYYPKVLYNIGRTKAMKSFHSRRQLYFTPFFNENYEFQAKNNIKLELGTI